MRPAIWEYVTASIGQSAEKFESDNFSLGSTAKEPPEEDVMKRNLIGTLSLVVMSLLLSATGAFAQSAVTANVPFAFKVGQAQLPAGIYKITTGYQSLTVSGIGNTMKTAYSQAQWDSPRNKSPRLVFHHVGNQYFLAEVCRGAGNAAMTIPASKLETELQMASSPAKTGGEIAIALH